MSKPFFTIFPPEIRERIWYFATLAQPRHVDLRLREDPDHPAAVFHLTLKSPEDIKRIAPCTQICHEAREVALTMYTSKIRASDAPLEEYILFNPLIDTAIVTDVELALYEWCMPKGVRRVRCVMWAMHMHEWWRELEKGNPDILCDPVFVEFNIFVHGRYKSGEETISVEEMQRRLESHLQKMRSGGPSLKTAFQVVEVED